jgi:predicted acylesterase/phospholipase RssA
MTTATVENPFSRAELNCDVILKGGVTSGIVYPLAVCELAKEYQFRRLGGTSSGAIVAAFAAAAEYHRQEHGMHRLAPAERPASGELRPGFLGMQDFANDLQTGDKLFSVFKPDAATKPIFDVLFAGHLETARGRKASESERAASADTKPTTPAPEAPQPATRTLIAFWSHVPKALPAIGGTFALAATLLVIWPTFGRIAALAHDGWRQRLLGDALALLVTVVVLAAVAVGVLIGAVVSAVRLVRRKWIPTFVANGFGLTRGLASQADAGAPEPDDDGPEPYSLTTWMTRIINELAGRNALDVPLTLGDLRRAGGKKEEPTVQFETITTCLTLGRPFRVPHDLDRDLPFYFDPDEWRSYFPTRVIALLKKKSPERPRHRKPHSESGPAYYRLPHADDLPVVVATRLSVALPVVLSAVPLWSVDRNARGARETADMPLERAWFSDGGIGSNFPIHFFDALIPRWPTFGIDLREANEAYPLNAGDEKKNVWMPLTNEAGRTEWWKRFASDREADAPLSATTALQSVAQFAGAIAGTAVSWRDNTLSHEAGFRDRIAHVKLDSKREGGLNLDMPHDVIGSLLKRGAAAGALLRYRYTRTEAQLAQENETRERTMTEEEKRFWKPVTVSWENHRWVRFRASMAALQEALERMDAAYNAGPGYVPLVKRPAGQAPLDFQWSEAQRIADPVTKTAALLDALQLWRADPAMRFDSGSLPERRPELRMSPPV